MLRSKYQRQQRQSNHRAEEAGDGPYSHEQWARQWPSPKSRAVDSWRTGLIQSLSQFGIFQVLPSAVALPGVVLIEIWNRENFSTFPVRQPASLSCVEASASRQELSKTLSTCSFPSRLAVERKVQAARVPSSPFRLSQDAGEVPFTPALLTGYSSL